ncbi:GyrI-like domain-containing protein [Aquibacillus rhizosphaerae]|uniref:GyrI-like domain-containing protein n=1 Tax=Aquibacillus rhizosphaerae TaxID=3051431 RepID=A0ABT7KZK4_9BACI|nr:GyrI-like domain-containing protein [Aquibacillus sp. LR5S19]MDL4838913.1 GyrI-like domain-containing protein [Aquibacillus sp. LR5S19]
MSVEIEKSLTFNKLVSLRKKMEQKEIQQEVYKMSQYLDAQGVRKLGPLISATFGIETQQNKQIFDMEFLVAVDRELDLPEDYTFKQEFRLVNAIFKRHTDSPEMLESTYNELNTYIQQNDLLQITAPYNVNVNDVEESSSQGPVIDVYIGISPNRL